MKINKDHQKTDPVLGFIHKIRMKRTLSILLLGLGLSGFGFGCVLLGGYLYKINKENLLVNMLTSFVSFDLSFMPNKVKGDLAKIDEFKLDLKFINHEKIRYYREQAVSRGIMRQQDQLEVPARLTYNNEVYNVGIALTGRNPDHFAHPSKWSVSVKVKKGKTIKGMRKFNLLVPEARGFLTDWLATTILKARGLIGIRNDFIQMQVNGDNMGLYYLEEKFEKRLVESNSRKEGIIFRIKNYEIEAHEMQSIKSNPELNSQLILLKKLYLGFLDGTVPPEDLFDMKKLAAFAVVSDLVETKHAFFHSNLRFYFNPITGLCEPISREQRYFQSAFETSFITVYDNACAMQIEESPDEVDSATAITRSKIYGKIFNNPIFEEHYIKEAALLADKNYVDSILNSDQSMERLTKLVYKVNPFYKVPIKELHKNQDYFYEKLHPKLPFVEAYFQEARQDTVLVAMKNKMDLPVEVHFTNYNGQKVLLPENRVFLKSRHRTEDSLQVIQILLSKDIDPLKFAPDSLEITYSLLGMPETRKTLVFPKQFVEGTYQSIHPARQSANFKTFDFLEINEEEKRIVFPAQRCEIKRDMVVPSGYVLMAKPGCEIDLLNEAKIVSYSPVVFLGKSDSLITMMSSDSTGQGLVALDNQQRSEMAYVNFKSLSNISSFGWDLRGAITFYESPVTINHCNFIGNLRGDDYLNIVRTDFTLLNSNFNNTLADALDTDFCSGTIENVKFHQVGNDAIDVSGTQLHVADVSILSPADKGLSAGEGSNLICKNIEIIGGEIAVASKDNSTIELDNISIHSSKLAYSAFQKKPEYGPGIIKVQNANMTAVETAHLIENGSFLSINGEIIKSRTDMVKDRLYGAEFGKSSK